MGEGPFESALHPVLQAGGIMISAQFIILWLRYKQQQINEMISNSKEVELELDQLIDIVNCKARELKPLQQNGKDASGLTSVDKSTIERNQFSKTLRFKPWSGKDNCDYEEMNIIKEEIDGIEEKEGEESCGENDKIDTFSEVSNLAKHDQIGYFYKFQNHQVKLIKKGLDENGFKCAITNKNWTLYWSSTVIKNEVYQALLPYQKINHFPNSFHLTRKDLMNKYLSRMQIRHGMSHFNFLPKTFILPQELDLLKEEMNKNPGMTFIAKPHNRSQGKGITVTNQLSMIYSKLEKYSSLIVSHYVDNPLLINGLKFDLRIYVAVTSVNPLRIYVYEEGLGRFATEVYDENNEDCENKKFQHLTNYSVNKKNTEFVKSQKENEEYFGSKWSLTALKDFLTFNVGKDETSELFDRIDDLMVKTILSVENVLHTAFMSQAPFNNCCYQVLGFDVLIDSNLKAWLMEVNMSSSMNTDSPLDLKIKGNMISDLFTMIGVAPLTDRYLDGNHLRQDIKNYKKPDHKQIELGPVQRFLLKEVEAENNRRGAWKRVFPVADRRYKQFFEVDRYYNRLLREHGQPQETALAAQYRSVPNARERASMPKKDLKASTPSQHTGYNSVNERRKRDHSSEKPAKFSIRTQARNGPSRRVYM